MYGLKISIFFVSVFLFFTSCKKTEEYPIEPFIEWQSFIKNNSFNDGLEHYQLLFKITDGDGDIGYKTNEDPDSANLFISFYEQINGEFVLSTKNDVYKSRLPYVQPNGATKAIKADVEIDVALLKSSLRDTFRFEFYINDRAMHKSNTIQSPVFIK